MISDRRETAAFCSGWAPDGRALDGYRIRRLLDEASPGLPPLIAQDDPVAIGNARYGVPIGIAESVANRLLAHFFGGASPDISVLVAQLQMIPMAESVQPRAGGFFFKAKESARNFAVDSTALEDASASHTLLFGQWARFGMRCSP